MPTVICHVTFVHVDSKIAYLTWSLHRYGGYLAVTWQELDSKIMHAGDDIIMHKRCSGTFVEEFELQSFPFDSQELHIVICFNVRTAQSDMPTFLIWHFSGMAGAARRRVPSCAHGTTSHGTSPMWQVRTTGMVPLELAIAGDAQVEVTANCFRLMHHIFNLDRNLCLEAGEVGSHPDRMFPAVSIVARVPLAGSKPRVLRSTLSPRLATPPRSTCLWLSGIGSRHPSQTQRRSWYHVINLLLPTGSFVLMSLMQFCTLHTWTFIRLLSAPRHASTFSMHHHIASNLCLNAVDVMPTMTVVLTVLPCRAISCSADCSSVLRSFLFDAADDRRVQAVHLLAAPATALLHNRR